MRALLIALSLPLVIADTDSPKSVPAKGAAAKAVCQPQGLTATQDGVLSDTRPAPARKFGDLPPAKQQLAVIRMLDGCDVPTVIREDIGGR